MEHQNFVPVILTKSNSNNKMLNNLIRTSVKTSMEDRTKKLLQDFYLPHIGLMVASYMKNGNMTNKWLDDEKFQKKIEWIREVSRPEFGPEPFKWQGKLIVAPLYSYCLKNIGFKGEPITFKQKRFCCKILRFEQEALMGWKRIVKWQAKDVLDEITNSVSSQWHPVVWNSMTPKGLTAIMPTYDMGKDEAIVIDIIDCFDHRYKLMKTLTMSYFALPDTREILQTFV